MKRITLAIALLIFILKVSAQEKLITQNGDVKLVYNVAIAANKVFYTLDSNEDSPIHQINKADLLTIIHPDGTKELFNLTEADDTKTTEPTNTVPPTTSTNTHPIYTLNHDYHTVEYLGKIKDKARLPALYLGMQLRDSSILEDDNMSLEYKFKRCADAKGSFNGNYSLSIELKNKTNKTLYIDLGNSFMIRGDKSEPYYIPSITSTTQGTTKGGSVNLGGISNALGVGGVAGSVLSGVNVGGGSTSQTTTTTYAQRVIAIPAMTRKELPEMLIFLEGSNYDLNVTVNPQAYPLVYVRKTPVQPCRINEYDAGNSPLNLSASITYSSDEVFSQTQKLQAVFFVKQIIGLYDGTNFLSLNYKDNDFFWVRTFHQKTR